MKPRLNAYLKQIQSGDFKTKKLCVIAILKESPKTLEYFRKNTNYSHQSLTSVLSVLCDEGMVPPAEQFRSCCKGQIIAFEELLYCGVHTVNDTLKRGITTRSNSEIDFNL